MPDPEWLIMISKKTRNVIIVTGLFILMTTLPSALFLSICAGLGIIRTDPPGFIWNLISILVALSIVNGIVIVFTDDEETRTENCDKILNGGDGK